MLNNIIDIMKEYGAFIGLLALIGIEISPIKINPFKAIGGLIGYLLGIKALDEKIDKVDKKVEENERDRIRYEILQFSGSLRNGLHRTENDYTHIEELYEKYKKHGWNSYISSEMEFIRECRNSVYKSK